MIMELEDDTIPVIGITGEDIYRNDVEAYRLTFARRGWEAEFLNLEYTGDYEQTMFGLPSLCLLARSGNGALEIPEQWDALNWNIIPKRIPNVSGARIAIPSRYKNLILQKFGAKASQPEWVPLEGKVEVAAAADPSIDYAVDIILSGRTARENNMGLVAGICRSDGVMLSNREATLQKRYF